MIIIYDTNSKRLVGEHINPSIPLPPYTATASVALVPGPFHICKYNPDSNTVSIDETLEGAFLNNTCTQYNTLIMQALDAKKKSPVQYNGYNWDVDVTAQENIKGWLDYLRFNRNIPPGFIWRDADNVSHPIPDADALESLLSGILQAAVIRGTALYAKAWAKKAELYSIADAITMLQFDPNIDWEA